MRRLRLALQRLRAFRLTRKCFSLGYLKSRYRARRDSTNSRSSPPSKPLSMAKYEKSRPAFIGNKQHCGKSAGLDQLLLLACNPCAVSTAGMVVDSYKFQIQGKKKISAKSAKNKAESDEIWEKEKSWNIVTQVGDDFVTKKVILKKKSKKKLAREEPAPVMSDQADSGSCSSSRYRLSTSSSAADDQNHYSWDKELSFASGDDRCLDEDRISSEFLVDRLEATSKDVFIAPPVASGGHFLDDSFFSLDHYIRSVQSAGDKHFPSPDCSSKIGELELEEKEQPKKMVSSSNCGSCDCGALAHEKIPAEKKVGGVAVAKFSVDPYRDYKDSMLEMSAANGLEKMSEFRELLQCYLSLNPPEFHATIMEVFTELFWHRLV
ncbi:uncharacterized protein LOC9634770 [Selaginella moellendorffii]|nr:uncharacterized protein LOC9634770 [Selaginella moellendorffii]XP_024540367.1 uncharacterized protein LOC9634770 [Selaginella moellendorffii]XP_024540368.1 uncharacterized protein LOC9634770 [Selaginella moellendorffii]XP_024540369.1 uncharacterized protein LOC9634770 [Selaginella moellendorffii]|eukprot:XP_002979425.2 uncharacterized protein LOC9634770 [Selaginella moellendorffii]